MPYSKQTFAYAGGARTFTLALDSGYDSESNISVFVVDELTGGGDQIFRTFTFDSEFVVNVTDAIDNPSSVVVQRTVSPTVFSVDFEAGADVTKRNLQLAFRQQFFLMQEILDGRVDSVDIDQRATDAETAATAAAVSAAAAAASAALVDADEIILRDGSVDFTAKIIGVAPTSDLHLATKKYVDDSAGGGGVMLLDGSQQMSAAMLLVNAAPTLGNHATRKTYVDAADALKSTIISPTFTGTVVVPDQSADDNSTKAANTKYVDAQVSSGGGGGSPAAVQTTTSGTSKTFGSIPSGTNRITVLFDGISSNGSDVFWIQIGDAGGIESSGYLAEVANHGGGNTETDAFVVSRQGSAALAWKGSVQLSRVDGNRWVSAGNVARPSACDASAGKKTLSDTLTQLKILMSGAGTFDLGRVNIIVG